MKKTTQISIQNTSTSRAFIQVFHKNKEVGTECGGWYAAPGVTVGPLNVSFDEFAEPPNNVDWWSAYVLLVDGPGAGRFTIEGDSVPCNLKTEDIDNPPVIIMDGKTLQVKLCSGVAAPNLKPIPGAITGLDNTPPITNVFVLMLENHSFDNLFAMCGIKGVDVATTNDSNVYNGKTYYVTSPARTSMLTDPGHEFEDVVQQLTYVLPPTPPKDPKDAPNYYPPGSVKNSGFAANYAASTTEWPHKQPPVADIGDIMACFNPDQIPNLSYLARNYVICDRWFSSMPGPTWPNRFFLHGGSSGGLDHSFPSVFDIIGKEVFSGFSYPKTEMNPQGQSIFDRLSAKNLSWRLYNDRSGPLTGSFAQASALEGISPISSVNDLSDLASDLQAPYPYVYTFIEPNWGDASSNIGGSSQHPVDDVAGGDQLVAKVFNAIAQSPLWKSSLLIIVYDEHGGFYDHVIPPAAVDPEAGNQSDYTQWGFDWKQYGVRVPAIIVSPLLLPGVDHTLYDHTSVLATLNILFGIGPLTQRDAKANNLRHLIWDTQKSDSPPATVNQPPTLLPGKPIVAPTLKFSLSPDLQAQAAKQPLPDKGNICGMLRIAMKAENELSNGTPEAQQAILAKARTIKTKGEAQEYMESIMSRARVRRQQLNQK